MTITVPDFDTEVAAATPPANNGSRLNRRERRVIKSVSAELDERFLSLNIVQAEINFNTAGNRTVADHGTGITIPAGAVVTRVLTKVTEDLDSTSHTGTAQLFLGASSGGLSLGAAVACDGNSVIQAWTVESSTNCPGRTAAAASELIVKVATNAISAPSGTGTIQYIVEYITPV
jgi:hypothetical protein